MNKKICLTILLILVIFIGIFVYFKFISPIFDETNLKPLVENHNNKNADRINIVFFLIDFVEEDEIVEFIQRNLAFETGEIIIHEPARTYVKNGETINSPEKFTLTLGTFSIEPFKSNKNKFNLWYVLIYSEEDTYLEIPDYRKHTSVKNLDYIQPVIIYAEDKNNYSVPRQHTGLAYLGVNGIINGNSEVKKNEFVFQNVFDGVGIDEEGKVISTSSGEPGLVWAHEFGHSIFSLRDEYFEEGGRAVSYGYPNCAHNISEAEQWWGGLIGEVDDGYYEILKIFENFINQYSGEGILVEHPIYENCNEEVLRISYVQGGCYGDENADVIRPNQVSMMGSGSGHCPVFGSVNKRQMQEVLNLFSGK